KQILSFDANTRARKQLEEKSAGGIKIRFTGDPDPAPQQVLESSHHGRNRPARLQLTVHLRFQGAACRRRGPTELGGQFGVDLLECYLATLSLLPDARLSCDPAGTPALNP